MPFWLAVTHFDHATSQIVRERRDEAEPLLTEAGKDSSARLAAG